MTETSSPRSGALRAAWQRPGVRALVAFVLAAVILAAGLVATDNTLRGARADLTRQQRYTLAPVTDQVLDQMQGQVTLRLYYSPRLGEELPAYADYFERVRNLLREYQARSGDKLTVEVIKPEPFSEAEDRAVAAGLNQIPVGDDSNASVLFGLVATNMVDDREVIPFLERGQQNSLEFELTRMVHTLAQPDQPVVGILTDLPVDGGRPNPMRRQQQQPWTIYEKLGERFDVRTLSTQSVAAQGAIPEDVDTLLVIHPTGAGERVQYAIDQFALRGGGVMAFVDPHSETAQQQQRRRAAGGSSSNLPALFEHWGVTMDGEQVVGDLAYAQPVRTQGGSGTVEYPVWLNLTQDAFNRDDIATAEAQNVVMASVGALARSDDAAVDWTPLITTSDETARIATSDIIRPQPSQILRDYSAESGRAVLGARLSGEPGTAFPDGPPEAQSGQGQQNQQGQQGQQGGDSPESVTAETLAGDHLESAQQPLQAVVFSDTDILGDRFWVRTRRIAGQEQRVPRADNGDVVLNATESLTGDINLAAIRAKDRSAPQFTRIQQMERQAARQYRQKEQELRQQLQDIQQRLSQLRGASSGSDRFGGESDAILSQEQEKAIEEAEQELLATREELRRVQREAREERQALERSVQVVNIAGMPVVVALVAVGLGLVRTWRRRQRQSA